MAKVSKREQQEYIDKLRDVLKPGDKLVTVLRHVSSSGMSRAIDVYKFYVDEKGAVNRQWLSYWVAKACEFTFSEKRDAITVGGCGMDMGYHVVYTLARVLWPDGFECIGKGCPSNDHTNGDRNYEPHHHNDGGYCLQHEWL